MSVKDKVVVVTGASSGIGAATVKLLVARGAKVVFGARRVEKLAEVAKDLPTSAIAYQATDVANAEDVQRLLQLAIQKFGKIDVLFNNAGIMPENTLASGQHQAWQQTFAVNVMGVLNGISAVLPIMHQQGYGHILTTDSLAGYRLYPNLTVYSASKFAVRAIMEGLRREELANHIRTTVIAPGMVATELYKSVADEKAASELVEGWQKGHALTPQDLAEAIVYAIGTPQQVAISELKIHPSTEF